MTITVHDLPAVPWMETKFDTVRPHSVNRTAGRRTEQVIWGTPFWRATFSTPFLTYRQFGLVEAFIMHAGDGGEVFRGYDTSRPRPIEYHDDGPLSGTRAGGGSFDGTATLSAIVDANTVSISGLPANFQFRAGDYISFEESSTVASLHRIMSDAQADGSGVASLSIKHALDTEHFTTAATVHLEKPFCLMQVEAESYEPSKVVNRRQAKFSATEVFYYEVVV